MTGAPSTYRGRLSRYGLSVLALGLSAFSVQAFAEDDPVTPSPEAVQSQADDLRQLFEAASRDGLVQLRDRPDAITSRQSDPKKPSGPYQPPRGAADCMQLAPLFDGGQGGFENGFFTELATDVPESAALAETLEQLVDISYDGSPLPVDLSSAGNCGSSFLPWQALAAPEKVLDAETEARLATALGRFKPALRRQVGVHIAIRAGLSDNLRLSRRIADTLTDEGLHRTARHDADIEHVLLDAILLMGRDPVGARARLGWVADRDGPEQLIAIDLLQTLDAAKIAKDDLTRMTESPLPQVAQTAHERLLATAIENRDMGQLSHLLEAGDDLSNDDESVRKLSESLSDAIMNEDPLKAILALDLYKRLDANGVDFGDATRAKAAARLKTLTSIPEPQKAAAVGSGLPSADAPRDMNGPKAADYLDTISDDLTRYQEVLDRG